MRSWLQDRGSLTARLRALAGDSFQVTVLQQRWAKPRLDEAQALGIPTHQYALIREVILSGNGGPWVYARSVLPIKTLSGPLRFLRKFGNRPLGELLFNNAAIQRGAMEIAVWPPVLLSHTPSSQHAKPYLARRSIFQYRHTPMLVSEVFLRQPTPTIRKNPIA